MRSYRNPFRYRTSEQQQRQGLQRFLKTYGPDVLDFLPEELWDRPLVVRSAPGGGKTSLLRAFTFDSLTTIVARPDEFEELHQRMIELGAIDNERPLVLGAKINLSQDYRDIMDLGVEPEVGRRIFFRLLDSHIVRSICEATSLAVTETSSNEYLRELELVPTGHGSAALERLGGQTGEALWSNACRADSEVRDLLDSVLPIPQSDIKGHAKLYSLQALSGVDIVVAGQSLKLRPLIMFDDGQELSAEQRDDLLTALTDRTLDLPRWYTERFSALSPEEVVGDGEPGRAYNALHIERASREMSGQIRRGRRVRPFEAMLLDVADRRASKPLADYGDETETEFTGFLDVDDGDLLNGRREDVLQVLRQRVLALAGGRSRYEQWLSDAEPLTGYRAALRWRELEILISRDRDRPQLEMLDLALTNEELKTRSNSQIREAAALFLRNEFRIPYYWGAQRLAKLGSQNIEQFLTLSGNMFEEMLALLTMRRRPYLDAQSQDRIVRTTSETMWRAIPQRRSYGRDMQHLLLRIASLAERDTYRSNAPYAPGVTGTALSMRDRARMLDPRSRQRLPGCEELTRALAGAIGHNLISAELNRSVKGDRWMVLNLNRLLCARFNLPIGYGGFRERPLEQMCGWMAEPMGGDLAGIPVPSLFEDI